MILLLAVAFGLITATVILHAVGTLEAIGHLARIWRQKGQDREALALEIQLVRTVSVLLLLHFVEAGIWAGLYRLLGLLPDMETAVYFSLTNYTTLGYGDVVLASPWRLLGPIEGAVGILMFGWSTAILVAVLQRMYADRIQLQVNSPVEGDKTV